MRTLNDSNDTFEGEFEAWQRRLGFRFNPFGCLEASTDSFLGEYMVAHDAFAIAWQEVPSLIFAPAGGGKTAMRLYTTRICWSSLGGTVFPIPYVFSDMPYSAVISTLDGTHDHRPQILRMAAVALLIGAAYHPERFLDLDRSYWRHLIHFLRRELPGSLDYYVSVLETELLPAVLASLLDRTLLLNEQPSPALLRQLCHALHDGLSEHPLDLPLQARFDDLIDLLRNGLGFRAIFLLLDGIDALPETSNDSVLASAWLDSLIAQATDWLNERILLKGFLPKSLMSAVALNVAAVMPSMRVAELTWTPPLLAEVLRRRVYVASGGNFGSLDAVSSPALRDIETMLVRVAHPLPREVVLLAGRVLYESYRRNNRESERLEAADVEMALSWYQKQEPY
ncbi:MAG: hypothetical protein WBV59_15820 [Anaerolineae bacterium]